MKTVRQLPGLEQLAPKLERLHPRIFDKITAAYQRNDDEFNVLLHGDMWANNVMFRYSDGDDGNSNRSVAEARFVDFQAGYWASATLDVTFTMFTSSHFALRAADWDELFLHYYNELVRLLTALSYAKEVPTLEYMQKQRKSRGDGSAMMSVFGLVFRNLEDSDNGMQLLMSSDEANCQLLAEHMLKMKFRENLRFLIEYLNENGHFD